MKKRKMSKAFIVFAKITGAIGAYILFKPKVYYENKRTSSLKLEKPCILMSNHTSLMDFPFYLAIFPFRTIRFLMAEVLFAKGEPLSSLLYLLGGIFVDRNSLDLSFMSEAIAELDKGGTVGVFPEGRLPVDGKSFPFKTGIAMLAVNSDAVIVPVCTDGNYGIFKRAHVLIGEKIYIKDHIEKDVCDEAEYERLTKMLEDKMNRMKEDLSNRIGGEKNGKK